MAFEGNTTPFEVPDTDTVYISNLPASITEQDLAEYFGSIGVIKTDKKLRKPKIWLYRDKATGALKGDGTVTYEDPFAAASALQWFNDKEFKGSVLKVCLAERKEPDHFRRGGGFRGGSRRFDGPPRGSGPPSWGDGRGMGRGSGRGYEGRGEGRGFEGRGEIGGGPGQEWQSGRGHGRDGGWGDRGQYGARNQGHDSWGMTQQAPGAPQPPPQRQQEWPPQQQRYQPQPAQHPQPQQQQVPTPCPPMPVQPQQPQQQAHESQSMVADQQQQQQQQQGYGAYDQGYTGAAYGYDGVPQPSPEGMNAECTVINSQKTGNSEVGGQPAAQEAGQWAGDAMVPSGRGRGRGGPTDGDGMGRGRGRKVTAAPQGPPGLFGPDDWPCPSCGNTNWARRPRCNLCGCAKPGTQDMKREGQAGGFKELDEREIEEARRRRREQDDDDKELYDDYGRVKKKYRSDKDRAAREQAALERLRGGYDPSPSGQEQLLLAQGLKEKDRDKNKERDKEKEKKKNGRSAGEKEKESSKHRHRSRSRDRDKEKHRDKGRERERERGRDREGKRDRERERGRESDKHRR
ncbi:unnamed protein product [Ostreobium quekettii]|uniref:Uncharacterized protein n=1 Tax=Ostreobium quekettii TaxID=121088 RepID=A0A8S1J0A5_9CHLO|nr:unnamed protein product [Ostreobium quekettii]|eukprot:evm.model.scf_2252.1 EVM.evm.TU.scf_2252.1   scf_2252:6077-11289(+)